MINTGFYRYTHQRTIIKTTQKIHHKQKNYTYIFLILLYSLIQGYDLFRLSIPPEGVHGHIICDNKLKQLAKRHDNLQSVASKCNSKTKRHLNQRMAVLRHKMKNIVNFMHWKTCSFLCNNFATIVMPPFQVK